MKTIEEKIAVMQAFADGKKVEYFAEGNDIKNWYDAINPSWDWSRWDYRIKEEPKDPEYIPFSFEDAEQLIGKVVKSKNENWIELLTFFDEDCTSNITYEALLRDYTFIDGSPCGKLNK